MGSRIHKIIGWGVDNFEAPEELIERINNLYDMSKKDFAEWLKNNREAIKQLCKDHFIKYNESDFDFQWNWLNRNLKSIKEVGHTVNWDEEYGLNAIIFCPFELHDVGRRYDNLIDYLEADDSEPRWRWLNKGIYPFREGEKPMSAIAVCLFLGLENLIPNLREALYVYWG